MASPDEISKLSKRMADPMMKYDLFLGFRVTSDEVVSMEIDKGVFGRSVWLRMGATLNLVAGWMLLDFQY